MPYPDTGMSPNPRRQPNAQFQPRSPSNVASQVIAVTTPAEKGWRWRIINAAGEALQESTEHYPTIAKALAEGQRHLAAIAPGPEPKPKEAG